MILNSNNYIYSNTLTNNRVLYIDESGKLNTTNTTTDELENLKKDINDIKTQLSNQKSYLLDAIYPVGSIYITIGNTNPSSTLGGTWTQLGEGYALWTANSNAGGTINAGLPNITGTFSVDNRSDLSNTTRNPTYAFNRIQLATYGFAGGSAITTSYQMNFNASNSNPIYGNSTTVQPPAYKVYAWRRVN